MDLQYNIGYHLHCELAISSVRSITVERLDQQMTYAGLLEGTPNADLNTRIIERALLEAQRHCEPVSKPYLINPLRRVFCDNPETWTVLQHGHAPTPLSGCQWYVASEYSNIITSLWSWCGFKMNMHLPSRNQQSANFWGLTGIHLR